MGCACYEKRADEAADKIQDLNMEKRSYENLQALIAAAVSNLGGYKNYYSGLYSKLSEIIVAGVGFQASACSDKVAAIGKAITELNDLKSEVQNAITDIEGDLRTQRRILSQRSYTCNSCALKAAQSSSGGGSSSAPKVGGTPSSRIAAAHYLN